MAKNLAGKNIPPGNGGVIFPSPIEWPVTSIAVTGITNAVTPTVTAPNHGFTQSGVPQYQVDFSQVKGMSEINGKFGYIVNVLNVNQFTIALNTTNFSAYRSGGFVNILASSGAPTDPFTNTFA